jgi:predicted flap endonuclease-1-like 5' DNA nuclease
MGYLVMQIAFFLLVAAMTGVSLGWWGARKIHATIATNCQNELAGLRRNYEDATRDNLALRTQLRQMDNALRKVSNLSTETDYGEFLENRKALENTRRQYEALLEKLHQQEQTIQQVRGQLQQRQTELTTLKQTRPIPLTLDILPIATAPTPETKDDLTRIEGINPSLASKLQALGIMTYRQIAEFTRDDFTRTQRILGLESPAPCEAWVEHAHQLFQQKYRQA